AAVDDEGAGRRAEGRPAGRPRALAPARLSRPAQAGLRGSGRRVDARPAPPGCRGRAVRSGGPPAWPLRGALCPASARPPRQRRRGRLQGPVDAAHARALVPGVHRRPPDVLIVATVRSAGIRTRLMDERPLPSYAVVSPVRDEARDLACTAACLVDQTHRPQRWVVVDDGSTDDTRAIAES